MDLILDGSKTWEIRGCNTKIRGEVALIESGTKTIVGTVTLEDCKKIETHELLITSQYHGIKPEEQQIVTYKNIYAWVLSNPKRFDIPKPYNHPQGAVIWVNL